MCQQVHVVNERLTRVLGELGDQTEGILQECRVLLGEVVDANLADVGHGNEVSRNKTSTSSVGN
mgnify:CR=1 FL=1